MSVKESRGLRLLIATQNRGKARELERMLEGLPVELVLPADVGLALDVEETGATFEANAELKARAFAAEAGLPTLADDSGLVVDALDGRPGVHSARYAGPPRSDRRNLEKLLAELRDVTDERRSARFVCVTALAVPPAGQPFAGAAPGEVSFFRGTCEGRIIREPRGTDGFGYDPVFVPEGLALTFAELPAGEKDARSHRGRAIDALRRRLVERLGTRPAEA
ncbi:MAG: RdgB/HAM1 family non-canonical purine NTP pyrophosphatase [Deltaproteobacteria bacterium]|nr:RdgB/HAM1 family non-canonical purine NTP pyrophosphatase [Deltaproteobacteria bacterium]